MRNLQNIEQHTSAQVYILFNAFWKLHMYEYADYGLRRVSLHLTSSIMSISGVASSK